MIRLGDLVILGPGSEWLWAMAQFLALSLTGIAILRQLRAQRSESLFEWFTALDTEWGTDRMIRARLAALHELRERDPKLGVSYAGEDVPAFFDRVGFMARRGHIRLADLWDGGYAPSIEWYWGAFEPYVKRDRERGYYDYPWFGWVAGEMRRLDAEHAVSRPAFDAANRVAQIDEWIEGLRHKLALEADSGPTKAQPVSRRRGSGRDAEASR